MNSSLLVPLLHAKLHKYTRRNQLSSPIQYLCLCFLVFHSPLPQFASLPSPCSNLAGSHGNHDVGCVASTIPLLLLSCLRRCSRSGGSATNRHLDDQVHEGLYRQRTCIAIIYVWDFAKETREKKQNSLLTIYGRCFLVKRCRHFTIQ